jgi:hypothetical protein
MQCALVEAHAMAPSKIASAPSCLPLAAWLRVNLSADVFQLGNKPCPRIASTHYERGLRTRNALRCDRRLPSSKRAVSILQLWCTLYLCMSRSTCIEPTLGSRRATWLRKRRRQRRRPARRKRSSLRRHTVPLLRHIKARARLCHREPILPRFDVVQ